ncbi:MAG: rhomboid family intramembrane serine protease, partial [Gemmatimonadetes bacterium]|nr:rhomboid family intramembrane serine protease [Gemmatimonadota bacterium]
MFLPWKDNNPTRITPWVTLSLIAANVAVFVGELLARDPAAVFGTWGLVPARILDGGSPVPLVTSLFLHGGFVHLGSNMLYLWIFGNNVEELFGSVRFLLFYFLAAMGAHAAHILAGPESVVPTVGASGAVAGILGAYMFRFPDARVHTL